MNSLRINVIVVKGRQPRTTLVSLMFDFHIGQEGGLRNIKMMSATGSMCGFLSAIFTLYWPEDKRWNDFFWLHLCAVKCSKAWWVALVNNLHILHKRSLVRFLGWNLQSEEDVRGGHLLRRSSKWSTMTVLFTPGSAERIDHEKELAMPYHYV